MAALTNTQVTYSTVGNREDLADKIFMISPTDCPFQSNIGTKKASNTLHQWQTDTLAAAGANAQVEGNEFSASVITPTTKVSNVTQISSIDIVVSGTQQAMNPAGRTREMVYQMMKANKELRNSIEYVLTNNQAQVSGDSTTARQLRPMVGWYATNIVDSTSGASAGNSTTPFTDGGSTAALTEANVLEAHRRAWTQGGDPDTVLLSAKNKVVFSNFGGPNGTYRQTDADKKKLYNSVSLYVTDFGELRVVASRFSRGRDVHVLDTSMLSVAYLRPVKTLDIAKSGDADKGKILAEYTLEVGNEASCALIADTNG